ncbi:tyrosine-protein phosphatase [Homoserinibacter sp. GY 40078]|uniref:tyrosine-protein phosphatase n=1 Tax=Homoserinibacter sp. GY 40078 TaxID=2603275 RepID=UPI0011C9C278|nr:tyrosine-protein phosphatase [Homoserinibacter sp. GY 40078]TXK19721.1 tyrosine-protein phosphatase [Homoserinibacter sp. GY 40078]
MSAEAPGAPIPLETLPNLRDVGGWPTADGRYVRRGVLYRSTALDRLSDADAEVLAGLGIRCVVDFRTETERTSQPDRELPGVRALAEDLLADSQIAIPAQLQAFFRDPGQAAGFLASGRADDAMRAAYSEIISLPSARAGYAEFYRLLLADDDVPLLYHCTTGKDRTGWATAALLALLGVSEADIYREYLLTNEQLLPALEPVMARFEASGASRDKLIPVLGVDASYLDGAFAAVRSEFGDIEGYFTDGLDITPDEQNALRERLTSDA